MCRYRYWDGDALEPYLSLPQPDSFGAKYVSFEDEQSLIAKGAFARENGYGGIIIWTINEGYVASRADPNFLMEALRVGFIEPPVTQPVVALPGQTPLPTDPDKDGLYEDLNGNGRLDFADVVLFFDQMDWITANEPVTAFDMNGNGRIDFNDIVCCSGRQDNFRNNMRTLPRKSAGSPGSSSFYFHLPPATSLIPLSRIPLFMDPIIARIRQELTAQADPEIQKSSKRYFKEESRVMA